MKLDNAIVLVTGANRGIGRAFAEAALARGARKVYAAARDPKSVTVPGVTPLALDITDAASVAAAVAAAGDVTVLVNNAGIATPGGFLADGAEESARRHLETNFFGTWRVAQAFAPVLARHGGGAVVNVLSIASFIQGPMLGVYAASKTIEWALTNTLRQELREQGTQVLGMHMGFVDTDLTRGIDAAKSTPESVVRATFDALEAGAEEVLADELTKQVKAGLVAPVPVYLAPLQR